jgi:hypothetical protein
MLYCPSANLHYSNTVFKLSNQRVKIINHRYPNIIVEMPYSKHLFGFEHVAFHRYYEYVF